ncbi:MAG: hypothetical protein KDC56_01250 [Flavobacteriaceae bacterium]|nr:hypothetical protein [Flavobacteriaceae bacterium]
MFWWVLLIVVVLLLVFLLVAPLNLYINTGTQEYYAQVKGLLTARLEPHEQKVARVHIALLFFHFYLYPLQYRKQLKKKGSTHKKSRYSRKLFTKRHMGQLLRSFTVKKLWLNIDTGDTIANAKLFPVCWLLNYTKGTFTVNFEGRNELVLHLQNRPIRILRSFI